MEFSLEQVVELKQAGHEHPKPGVRVKALAVLAVARGQSYTTVAALFDANYHSVSAWARGYLQRGLAAFEVAPGRGRPRQVDDEQLKEYARQSPRNFGHQCSRWTLRLLARTVPSLRGFSPAGVRQALRRCGLSYKRGQAWLGSPDPEFAKKKEIAQAAVEHARRHPGSVVALFQDEVSFYRQPSQGQLWSWAGRKQPHLAWSHRSNTLVRMTGVLDAVSGESLTRQASKISVACLLKFYQQVLDHYPQALLIYLIQDNWPNHKHEKVQTFLAAHPRLQVLFLPTYAPWLNPIEKLWRWVRQTFCHAHPFSDDFLEFKAHLQQCLADAAQKGAEMLGYCGVTNSKIYT